MKIKYSEFISCILILLAVLNITLFSGCVIVKPASKAAKNNNTNAMIGGPCTYASYEGNCKITSIQKTPASTQQADIKGGPNYEGYEIKFKFIPSQKIPHADYITQREFLLTLQNSWYPGERFLEKYNINVGSVFECQAKIITKGTCTPVMFSFKSINTTDYFER